MINVTALISSRVNPSLPTLVHCMTIVFFMCFRRQCAVRTLIPHVPQTPVHRTFINAFKVTVNLKHFLSEQ